MAIMKPLSDKQKDILKFIEGYIDEYGYPPSIRDIQNNCDISSTSVVKYNLDRLQEKGLMNRDSEVSRSISLKTEHKTNTIKVPVLGTITAGQPFPLIDDSRWNLDDQDMIDLPENFSHIEEKIFALKPSKDTQRYMNDFVIANKMEEKQRIAQNFDGDEDLKHLSELILIDEYGKEAFADKDYKRIRKGISQRLLSTNNESYPTIPSQFLRIDEIRVQEKHDKEKLKKVEIINTHLEKMSEDHEKYL